jgi:hypothetical protein
MVHGTVGIPDTGAKTLVFGIPKKIIVEGADPAIPAVQNQGVSEPAAVKFLEPSAVWSAI